MKLYKYILMLSVGIFMSGCYSDFGDVPPMVTYDSEQAFQEAFPDCQYRTIEQLKQIYAEKTNDPQFVGGENSGWNNTKYYQFEEDYYIRGKVISNDEQGNIYKSLYLLDDTGAIEVRLTNGNYLKYYMGDYDWSVSPIEIPSSYVYVRVKDLFIGNYRMMLSIGAGPTDSFNKRDEHKFYANSAIDNLTVIAEHVFVGETTTLKEGEDIIAIDATNYSSINGIGGREMLGRLVLFKGISCMYAGVMDQKGQTVSGIGDNIYPSWLYTENMNYANGILTKPWYNWAYSVAGKCLYGSVLFSYLPAPPSSGMNAGAYSLRTSGYSRFASRPIVKNGAKGDMLAIYGIYSKSWTYNYGAYQLSISRYTDIHFDESDYLSAAQVKALTPDGSDGTYYVANPKDRSFIAYDLDNSRTVVIDRESAEEASVIRPTFFTRYAEEGFDKFVNYPSYAALTSALVFGVTSGDATVWHAVKVSGDSVTTDVVTVADNCFDFGSEYAFDLKNISGQYYTIGYGDRYLAAADGSLVLSSEPYTWRIAIPASTYDKEKDSYYVSWVGEDDDEAGGQD